ncbi:MAG: glutathione S-transferase family protein [Leptolyngbyaceae bacterium]|nr:glutathione S-transferase family protein [Leptolyngbyaceae bacterium]
MNYKLYYWPVPFRGNFIRLLLEEADEPYEEATDEEVIDVYSVSPEEQPFPSMAPPFLHDLGSDIFLSQMPVIVMYLAEKLNFLPKDAFKSTLCLKLLLDSNDVLTDITNWNGTVMWEYETWRQFREDRLKRWLEIFEQTGQQFGLHSSSDYSTGAYMLGGDQISVADITTYALWGTMIRCLPELSDDCQKHAPHIFELCQRIERRPRVQKFNEGQIQSYGNLYCGGQIEKSIRKMLKQDCHP